MGSQPRYQSASSNAAGIFKRSGRPELRGARHLRLLDLTGPENVKDGLAGGDQVVGDDPPVTPPPQSFRTHDRAALGVAQFAQLVEPNVKVLAHGVVGVV